MRKRTTYDINIKLTIANEYASGSTTYASLSEKYGVPRPTVAKWIQRSKKYNDDSLISIPKHSEFLNVTNALQAAKEVPVAMTIVVNGLELKSDLNTLLRLLQGQLIF